MRFRLWSDDDPAEQWVCSFVSAIGTILASVAVGAGGGALLSAAGGGSPGTGALEGALIGGGGAIGGELGPAGSSLGTIAGGAAGGALGHAIEGGNPLTGAIEGAIPGLVSGISGSLSSPSGGAAPGAMGGAAPAATAGGAAAAPGDWSGAFQPGDIFSGGGGPGAAALGTGAAADAGTASAAGAPYGSVLPPNNTTGFISQSVATGNAPGTIPGVAPQPSGFLQDIGITSPTPGYAPVGGGGQASGAILPGQVSPSTMAQYQQAATGLPGAGASGGGAGGGTAADPGFLSNLTQGNFGAAAKDIPLGAVIGGGGLAYEALKGQPPIPNLSNLNQIAGQAESNSQTLINAELSGQLPAGAAAGVQQGLESAQAAIRSQFASLGLSGSAQEAEALATAAQTSAANSFNIAAQMGQQGISLAGLPAQVYQTIMQATLQNDQEFSQAVTNFATAAAGGGARIQIGGAG
jgi:hypothetical protein